MPQLDVSTYISQIFWLILFFSLTYLFVAHFVLPKIELIFAQRKAYIDNALKNISSTKNIIKEIDEECNAKLSHARKAATIQINENNIALDKIVKIKLAEIEQELKLEQKKSERNIAKLKAEMQDQLDVLVVNSVQKIMQDFMQVTISTDEIKSKIEQME